MSTRLNPVKVIIADDHEFFRRGFKAALQYETSVSIIAEAANGKELVELMDDYIADVVFMDVKMPVLNGIETTKILTAKYPHCAVIGFSSFDEHYMVEDMFAAGAAGYILKDAGKVQVMEAINSVIENKKYLCNAILRIMNLQGTNPLSCKIKKPALSPRQSQILQLICEQRTSSEIAEILHLSKRTVEGFRSKLFKKTNSLNEAGLVIYAINNGIYRQE